MTIEVLENGAERFVTAGGVTITRERHDTPYAGGDEPFRPVLKHFDGHSRLRSFPEDPEST